MPPGLRPRHGTRTWAPPPPSCHKNRSPPQRRALTSQPSWSLLDRRQQPSLITLRSLPPASVNGSGQPADSLPSQSAVAVQGPRSPLRGSRRRWTRRGPGASLAAPRDRSDLCVTAGEPAGRFWRRASPTTFLLRHGAWVSEQFAEEPDNVIPTPFTAS